MGKTPSPTTAPHTALMTLVAARATPELVQCCLEYKQMQRAKTTTCRPTTAPWVSAEMWKISRKQPFLILMPAAALRTAPTVVVHRRCRHVHQIWMQPTRCLAGRLAFPLHLCSVQLRLQWCCCGSCSVVRTTLRGVHFAYGVNKAVNCGRRWDQPHCRTSTRSCLPLG